MMGLSEAYCGGSLYWALEYHTLGFFLQGTLMKLKFILFSPWLLKSPDIGAGTIVGAPYSYTICPKTLSL